MQNTWSSRHVVQQLCWHLPLEKTCDPRRKCLNWGLSTTSVCSSLLMLALQGGWCSSTWVPTICVESLDEVVGSWLYPGPALAVLWAFEEWAIDIRSDSFSLPFRWKTYVFFKLLKTNFWNPRGLFHKGHFRGPTEDPLYAGNTCVYFPQFPLNLLYYKYCCGLVLLFILVG